MPFWLRQSNTTLYWNNLSLLCKMFFLASFLASSSFLGYFLIIRPVINEVKNKTCQLIKTQELCCLIEKTKNRCETAMEKHNQLSLMLKKTQSELPTLEQTVKALLDIAQKNTITCYSISPKSEKKGALVTQYYICLKGSSTFHNFLSFLNDLSLCCKTSSLPSLLITKNKKNDVSFTLWVGVFNVDRILT